MGLMGSIKSMNELTEEFNTGEAIANIVQICGLELDEIPHCDTINDIFENIKVEELESIIKYFHFGTILFCKNLQKRIVLICNFILFQCHPIQQLYIQFYLVKLILVLQHL